MSRRVGIVKGGESLRCPDGHRFKDPLVWNEGGLRCNHKGGNGELDCGKMVLLLGGGLSTPAGEPMFLLIEVTAEEMHEMKQKHMTWQQMVTHLGLEFDAAKS